MSRRFTRLAFAACASVLAAACTTVSPSGPANFARVWVSSADGTKKLAPTEPIAAAADMAGNEARIVVDPAARHQSMVGFGAGMTDASAYLFMEKLDPAQRKALFADLFGPDGIGIDFVRVPVGASDFSPTHYSLDDMPKGAVDPGLAHFSMAGADKWQNAALVEAKKANPSLELMASPWSAPGWMKTTDSLIKGHLKPEHYQAFANYFSRYLSEMDKRGLEVDWLSIQNEPHFEPENYPGMRVDPAERAAIIGKHLGPLLAERGQETKILDWDHNWDQPESPLAVLADPVANRYVSGVAWHCYGGDVSAMDKVRTAYPDKDVFFTECSGGEWAPKWGETLGWMTDNLVIAASRYGSRGTLLWNLALDEKYGPHNGGCGDCRGVVTIDSRTGAITRNVEYYVLGHAGRFVRAGARRVDSNAVDGIPNVAFVNPDGSRVVLLHNATDHERVANLVEGSRSFALTLAAGDVATVVWPAS